MCRDIRTLFNFEPPVTEEEVHAAGHEYVRKVSGSAHSSEKNRAALERAVEEITAATERLPGGLSSGQRDDRLGDPRPSAADAAAGSVARGGRLGYVRSERSSSWRRHHHRAG